MNPQPPKLPGLSAREGVTDALYRCLNGLDINDRALWESGWSKDHARVSFSMNGGAAVTHGGMAAINEAVFKRVGPLDTTHFICNPRVNVDEEGDAKTATLGAYALAQHYRPGEGVKGDGERLLSGSIYDLELEFDEAGGLWRVVAFRMRIVWHEGNMAVVQGD